MRSTFGGINTAYMGLSSHQMALDTVGHNVSNASTTGYSRQQVNVVSTTPDTAYTLNGTAQVGTGATVAAIKRVRDMLINKQMWQETSTLNYSKASENVYSKVETILNDSSNTGVQSVMNTFWSTWQNLATNASDEGVRATVRERGTELASAVTTAATQLKSQITDINTAIQTKVKSINETTSEICSLNKQIRVIESGGTDNANDLRDKRDNLVDQLSALIDVRVTEDDNGNYIVQGGGTTLVGAVDYTKISTTSTNDSDYGYEKINIIDGETNMPLNFSGGELAGLISMRDSDTTGVKRYLNDLSKVSQFLMTDFNAVHRSGFGTDNSTNINFFGATSDSTSGTKVGTTLYQTADVSAVTFPLSLSAGDLTIQDEDGNTLAFAGGTFADATALATAINNAAVAASPAINARAAYDSATNSFGIYTTGDNTTLTITASGTASALSFSNPKASYWLNNLTVNPDIMTSAGIAQIAAKTSNNNVAVTQSNAAGGAGTISNLTGTYTNGTTATNVKFTVSTLSGTNVATGTYVTSTDGGKTWSTASSAVSIPATLTIKGLTFKLDITGGTNAIGDVYNFTLSSGNVASGDNAALLSNKLKSDTSTIFSGMSLDSFYSTSISALGIQSQNAQRLTDNQQTLIDQITSWREADSGVNTDEELTNMIKFQKGYSASARVLTTMDEMLDKLINGTGTVGR